MREERIACAYSGTSCRYEPVCNGQGSNESSAADILCGLLVEQIPESTDNGSPCIMQRMEGILDEADVRLAADVLIGVNDAPDIPGRLKVLSICYAMALIIDGEARLDRRVRHPESI